MDSNKKSMRNIVLAVLGCILFYWLLHNFAQVGSYLGALIGPFLLGGGVAFVLNIPMSAIEKKLPPKVKKGRRVIAIVLSFLIAVGVIALVLLLLIPQLSSTAKAISAQMPGFWAGVQESLSDLLVRYPELESTVVELFNQDWQGIVKTASDWLSTGLVAVLGNTVSAAGSIVGSLTTFFIGVVFAIYLLFQKETLSRQMKMLMYAYLPEKVPEKILDVAKLTNKTFRSFLTGQCTEACILGAMFAVAMTICRMPYVLLISVLIAVTALIPIFGAFIGCIVGAFLILVQDPMKAFWFVVLFLCLQQIEGNLIYPRVVGNSVGLPSIWVMAAVTIGGSAMGIMGMLIMIPICSVLYTLLRTQTYNRLSERGVPKKKYLR